jgi:hypothetical protein
MVEETGEPGENHGPITSQLQTLSHYVVHHALIEIRTRNISGDRHWLHIGKSNYHTITATTAPCLQIVINAIPYTRPRIISVKLYTKIGRTYGTMQFSNILQQYKKD